MVNTMEMKFKKLLCWIEKKLQSEKWKDYVINITFKKYMNKETYILQIVSLFMKFNKTVKISFE